MEATVDHLNRMMSSLLTQNTSLSAQLASKKRKSSSVDSGEESAAEEDVDSEEFIELDVEEHEGEAAISDTGVSDREVRRSDAITSRAT